MTRGGPTDPVAGVVGVDVKLAEVKRLVNQQSGCASSSVRCMLLSETGHVIYHPDFAASAEETSEEVFLSKKHREVTAVLVKGGILQQQTCMDYASGMRKTSYKVVLGSSNSAGGTLLCGKWALSRLGGTKGNSNAYLLALSSNGCITGQKAAAACVPCDESNCKKWSSLGSALLCQPCRCKIMYDSCNLNYHINGSARQTPQPRPILPPVPTTCSRAPPEHCLVIIIRAKLLRTARTRPTRCLVCASPRLAAGQGRLRCLPGVTGTVVQQPVPAQTGPTVHHRRQKRRAHECWALCEFAGGRPRALAFIRCERCDLACNRTGTEPSFWF